MTSSSSLATALLAIYVTASLPIIYIAFKHGWKHLIGWIFLFIFCTLKIVASAIEMSSPYETGVAIVASIGLSLLLAAVCGALHESRAYILPKSRRTVDTHFAIFFHLLVTTAIALVAAGASKLSNTTLPADQVKRGSGLVKGGSFLLLISWILLGGVTVVTFLANSSRESKRLQQNGGKNLLWAVALSIPFLGIRVLESLVYYFSQNQSLNPVTGSLGLRVGLQVIEELVVTLALVAAGIVTRNIRTEVTTGNV
ncbi:hypothetical protein M426DRAFT_265148 [Hypoxylon sp. CI-4A]|nr:hypothetical protein M426DRAFT_265148 [Hypoxylon sp. CI-4A]